MSQIIDGRLLAQKHEQALQALLSQTGKSHPPTLVSFCNQSDKPSVKYTQMKAAKAEELGIKFITEMITPESDLPTILQKIQNYNQDPTIDGIMLQMPLPSRLEPHQAQIINSISPQKDVDGLSAEGQKYYLPATVKAVISLLDEADSNWPTKKIGLLGSTGEVGRPLMEFFRRSGVNATGVTRHVGNIDQDLKDCDVVISSTGAENVVKPNMVKPGFIAIDVGLGDFDPDTLAKASKYTPKTGGVGPMTVISLMENLVDSYQKNQ